MYIDAPKLLGSGTGGTTLATANTGASNYTATFPAADITVNAASSISGTTLAANVVTSSLTSVGALTSGSIGSGFTAIPNAALANASVTVNGTSISLGGSGTAPAAAGTLTGTTLASNVVTSSLTSVGALTSGSIGGAMTINTSGAITGGVGSLTSLGVTSAITGGSFIKSGGTSAQYLLADGSTTTTAGAVYKGVINGGSGAASWDGILADGVGVAGEYGACNVAGAYNYGSGSITLAIGDQLYYNGTVWLKIPGAGAYTLPIATASNLGGVKSGGGVSIDGISGLITVVTNANLTGDVTSSGNATTIGATKVTSAMLNADVFSTAHSWGGTQTFTAPVLGTPSSGVGTHITGIPLGNLVSGTLVTDLIFTDATYDIGKSGATRPRDFFLSRNAVVGGSITGAALGTLNNGYTPSVYGTSGGASSGVDLTTKANTPVVIGATRTNSTFGTPELYLERITATTSYSASDVWGNLRKTGTLVVNTEALAGEIGEVCGITTLARSRSAQGTTNAAMIGIASQADSILTSGLHMDTFGANLIASFTGAATKPQNCVGVEVDVIISQSTSIDHNYTGVWSQLNGAGCVADNGFYCTAVNGSWYTGIKCDAPFIGFAGLFNNQASGSTNNGVYINIQATDTNSTILDARSNGASKLSVKATGSMTANGVDHTFNATEYNIFASTLNLIAPASATSTQAGLLRLTPGTRPTNYANEGCMWLESGTPNHLYAYVAGAIRTLY